MTFPSTMIRDYFPRLAFLCLALLCLFAIPERGVSAASCWAPAESVELAAVEAADVVAPTGFGAALQEAEGQGAASSSAGLGEGTGMPPEGGEHSEALWSPPLWAVIPFIVMLLCIAIVPLINHHWWENDKNRGMISALLGIPVIAYTLLAAPHGSHNVLHVGEEYIAFIALLGSLFVISGGVVITGNLVGTPRVNTCFLATGALLASFIGTTGAAMVLIRPILNTNRERKHVLHTVIFFIFLVCNCGGCLTPLGDPPLFLGYLKGVPFEWTFNLWPEWLAVCGTLLVIYFVFDTIQHRKEAKRDVRLDVAHERPLVVRGAHNFLYLGGVIFLVAEQIPFGPREAGMLILCLLAWFTTRRSNRKHNEFEFAPILEVVVVFAGIFATMIPALALLNARGGEMGVATPAGFFWATGLLSSFLDNAPTYVSFLEMSQGGIEWAGHLTDSALAFHGGASPAAIMDVTLAEATRKAAEFALETKAQVYVIPTKILSSISLGAVFMGAMTYIGNGPNFMVRSIADRSGVKMPSFFGYLLWSAVILLPILAVTDFVFLA